MTDRGRGAGFALILVLSALVIATGLAAATLQLSREQVRIAAGVESRAQARAATDGAVWWAWRDLVAESMPDPGEIGAALGAAIEIEVIRHGDLAVLQRARPEALAVAAGALSDPGAFVAAVLDRRAAWDSAGVPWRLDGRPFQTLAEALALVPAAERAGLARRITVYGEEQDAVVTVLVGATAAGGAVAERSAVLTLTQPARVLEWR